MSKPGSARKWGSDHRLVGATGLILPIPSCCSSVSAWNAGLIKHFYKRPHADQILVTFGLAIVLQEDHQIFLRCQPDPDARTGGFVRIFRFRRAAWAWIPNVMIYPIWRLVYFIFAIVIICAVFAFLQFTTFGMVVRAGMADRETVGLLGIDIDKRFTAMFGIAALWQDWRA